jgi:hypothetical protein
MNKYVFFCRLLSIVSVSCSPLLVSAQVVETVVVPPSSSVQTVAPEIATPHPSNFISILENARTRLDASLLPSPDASEQKLRQSIANLSSHLGSAGSQRQSDWLSFLKIDQLQKQLDAEIPDLNELTQIEKNTRQNYAGLEMAAVKQLRNDLEDYIDALRFGADPAATIKGLDERLAALVKQFTEEADSLSELETTRDLGVMIGYLESANQVSDVQQSIVQAYRKPTARVLVSQSFINRAFVRPVNQTNPVNELILGTTLRGTSVMQGQVMPKLVSNASAATLELHLSGQFSSNNVGKNRGVTVLTSSNAGVAACETIQLTDHGLISFNDTGVDTNFQSRINSIQHKLKIVRKIASRKAAEQKPQADAIGQSRLERRLGNQFHEQLDEQLDESNARLQPPALPALSRLGLPRPMRRSWSSNSYLSLLWDSREGTQLAAPSSCPHIVPTEGITAQLHQSMIANYLGPVLSGRTIRSKDLPKLVKQFGAEAGEELAKESEGQAWAITLANYHPVEVEFEDEVVSFHIRVIKLERDGDDQALTQPATIRVNYKVELADGYLQLRRQGEVEIEFAGRAQRGTRAAALRGFLKSKFDKAFKETLFKEPIRPTDRLPANLPPLSIASVNSNLGWLQVTLN